MRQSKKWIAVALGLALAVGTVTTSPMSAKAASFQGTYFEEGLSSYDSSKMEKADGWTNGNPFDCTWRASNVTFNNGIMSLTLDRDNQSNGYAGAEYRSRDFFSYGMYTVKMKPIKNDGIVSSFFTYTGPSDGNPWDEIDIEFLGKDTTKVQFNYYTSGQGNHEYMYDLGFDASKSFHEYGFYWAKDSITWYVDGKAVYKATTNIPKTPGKIMMNVWNGIGVDGWLNRYDGKTPLTAEYDWFTYSKEGKVPASTEQPTVQPTTVAPTVAPTTVAPTTVAPTTVAPTTVAPTTVAPTTVAPTTVAPTTVSPTTAPQPSTGKLDVSYNINNWGSGYMVSIKVSNKSGAKADTWTVTIPKNQINVSSSWNVNIKEVGDNYVITPVSWNSTIENGNAIEFGIIGSGSIGTSINCTVK